MMQQHRAHIHHRGLVTGAALLGVGLTLAACSDPVTTDTGVASSGAASTIIVEAPSSATSDSDDTGDSGDAGNTGDTVANDDGSGTSAPTTTVEAEETITTSPWPELTFTLNPIVNLAQPTALAVRLGSDDLWLAERAGRVRRVERTVDLDAGTELIRLLADPVIDITDRITTEGEGGLLGIAFAPDGQLLYLHYTDRNGDNVIAEYPMDAASADPSAERILLQVDEPFSNHNGGDLSFGPDGLLYISLGDGGSAGDPEQNGQDRTTLLGSILRIDPQASAGAPYGVPSANPFVNPADGFRSEIWIWGARNPWRFSFDRVTGDLWIADVGQNRFEEINFLPASAQGAGRGANLGWNLVEGNEEFSGSPPSDHQAPIYTYEHRDGRCSVTGGYVYRGSNLPDLDGVYLYSDYCTGEVTGLARADDGTLLVANLDLNTRVENVIGFGQGPEAELYILEQNGQVSRLQRSDWPLRTVTDN